MASAEHMREVADIVCSFQDHAPVVVLSAMGKVQGACCFQAFCRDSFALEGLQTAWKLVQSVNMRGWACEPSFCAADDKPAAASRRGGASLRSRRGREAAAAHVSASGPHTQRLPSVIVQNSGVATEAPIKLCS